MGFWRAVQIQILLTTTIHTTTSTTTIISDHSRYDSGARAYHEHTHCGTWRYRRPTCMGIGVDFIPTAEHAAGLDETETHIIGCLPDYRNRIMEIIRFIRDEPSYQLLYEELIIELTLRVE